MCKEWEKKKWHKRSRRQENGGEMRRRKTEIAMGDCIKSDIWKERESNGGKQHIVGIGDC